MTAKQKQEQLGKALWDIANELRGAMNADDLSNKWIIIEKSPERAIYNKNG